MKKHLVASAIVTGVSVFIFIWLVFDPFGGGASGVRAFDVLAAQTSTPTLSFLSKTPILPSPSASGSGDQVGGFDPNNLTDSFLGVYLSAIRNRNINGPINESVKIPGANAVTDLIRANTAQKFTFEKYTERDVRVGASGSPDAQKTYLEALDRALRHRFNSFKKTALDAIKEFSETRKTETFGDLASIISNYEGDVLALQPPPSLAALHLEWLNVWRWKRAVYQAVIEYEQDPLKAYAALQDFDAIVNADRIIQSTFIEKYNELTKRP